MKLSWLYDAKKNMIRGGNYSDTGGFSFTLCFKWVTADVGQLICFLNKDYLKTLINSSPKMPKKSTTEIRLFT